MDPQKDWIVSSFQITPFINALVICIKTRIINIKKKKGEIQQTIHKMSNPQAKASTQKLEAPS